MATASKVPADYRVELNLSREEAEALLHVTYRISGDISGPRGRIDAIRVALHGAGVDRPDDELVGSLNFKL